MLQGNPFETERLVEERRKTVQHALEQQRQPRTAQGPREVRGWRLPAALASGTLLNLIFGEKPSSRPSTRHDPVGSE